MKNCLIFLTLFFVKLVHIRNFSKFNIYFNGNRKPGDFFYKYLESSFCLSGDLETTKTLKRKDGSVNQLEEIEGRRCKA